MRESFNVLPDWLRLPFVVLAGVSYPLYAVHGVFGYTILVRALAAGMSSWAAIGIAAAAVFMEATGVHFLIELPSQAYGKMLAAKIGPRTAPAGQAMAN
jgi:peptidoglycan/LPS O-acetylase OafA/YrhL